MNADMIGEYIRELLGDTAGFAYLAYEDDNGQHRETPFRVPRNRDVLIGEIVRTATFFGNVWLCPYPMRDQRRWKGNAARRMHVHADVDQAVELEAVRALRGFAVCSGTPSHLHIYLRLTRDVSGPQHRALCGGLRERLGGDDKINDNDLLRPPGTLNHKHDPPLPVTWAIRPDDDAVTAWEPEALAAELGVELPGDDVQDAVRARVTPAKLATLSSEFLTNGEPSAEVDARLAEALGAGLTKEAEGKHRHEKTRDHVLSLIRLGEQGEPGVKVALATLGAAYASTTDRHPRHTSESLLADFDALVTGAVEIVAADRGPTVLPDDDIGDTDTGDTTKVEKEQPEQAVTVRLADVKPERVDWLWQGRIPLGKVVTLDGDPGLGKSTLSLAFAAVVTTGEVWADGTRCDDPGDVVLLSAEDGLADTVRPRLDAAGADVTRVHAIQGVRLPDGTLRPPTLGDIAHLETVVADTGARLLIIDVLMAYLPRGADSHKDQDIRRVLARLSELADRTGCTVLLLRHLNKAKGADPLYRGGGSIGIVGAARAGLLVAPNPEDETSCVLASVKNNLAPKPPALIYRLVDSGVLGAAKVVWLGNSELDARTLLTTSAEDSDGDALTEAMQWVSDYLEQQGAAPSKAVKAEARKAGIAERTVERAAKKLGVRVEPKGFPRVTWWSLPCRATVLDDRPETPNLGATGATGPDLHKHVGATGRCFQSRQAVRDGATGPNSTPNARTICSRCGYDSVPEGHLMHFDCEREAEGETQQAMP
ncbi:AAA family ATPase [Nocardia sp. Marseille-Q1738]